MRRALPIATLLALLVALPATAAPPGGQTNFTAPLKGGQEVPAVDTDGTGVAILKLNQTGDALSFKLNVANIDEVTQSHIHCGPKGVNGPVVAFLFGFADPAVNVNGTLAQGEITNAQVIPRPADATCPGGVSDLDSLIERMREGNAYVNVHTLDNPGGEIRGQIK